VSTSASLDHVFDTGADMNAFDPAKMKNGPNSPSTARPAARSVFVLTDPFGARASRYAIALENPLKPLDFPP
jgi:hypothetical protein